MNINTFNYDKLDELANIHGDFFYLFYPNILVDNMIKLKKSFTYYWPNTRIAYSYKTNYMPYICKVLNQNGCLAEVVSGLEYKLAKLIGVPRKNIIFNGPYKQTGEMQDALIGGSVVNIDSPYEIEQVIKIARLNFRHKLRVGLRAGISVKGSITRFGLDLKNGDFNNAISQLSKLKNLSIVGFHVHLIPPGRHPEGYKNMMEELIKLYKKYAQYLPLEFLDIGGGFYSNMPIEMSRQFSENIPTFQDYGESIAGTMRQELNSDTSVELLIEPGMSLVADAMIFACRVIDIKNVCGRWIALLSGSIYNVKPSKSKINLPITIIPSSHNSIEYKSIDLVGYTCMEDDVIHKNFTGNINIGDFILIHNCGSYTLTLKPPFIQPNSPVIIVDKDESIFIAKRKELFEDIFSTYEF